ncbi:MAG: DUF1080 domain-containing protein [Planctomycetota bacterium]
MFEPILLAAALLAADPAVPGSAGTGAAPPSAQPAAGGWRSLFDGETLAGWSETGGPYDGDADWTVEDGAIVGREAEGARGGLLYTDRLFGDFEFECDVKIAAPFDSGIFVRMAPGARGCQFTLDDRPGGEMLGLYSDGWILHETGGDAAWRARGADEWKRVRVRCAGTPMHLVGWIDGRRVVDHTIAPGVGTFADRGRIGIQVHGNMNDPEGSEVRFRNLRVRELPIGAGKRFVELEDGRLALTAVGEASGWRSLFNGRDLVGWRPGGDLVSWAASGWRAQDGELQALSAGVSPFIRTERGDLSDFELRMDFRMARLANSGVYLRSIEGSNPSFNGCEVQILDDFEWESASGSKLAPYQFTGGLYGAVPAAVRALRPIGEWNRYAITCTGSRMQCVLNGKLLWDVDTSELEPAQGPPFAERALQGFVGMQRHAPASEGEHPEVAAAFRNLFLRELHLDAPEPAAEPSDR